MTITNPRPNYKNIVVIGGSVAGHNFINTLAPLLPAQFRIILIERNDFVLHAPIVVRALVVPGWEAKKFTAPVTQETIFAPHSRHRVVAPNTVLELRRESVLVKIPFEDSHEIFFEKCVIATGAQQPMPIRPGPGTSLADWKAALRETQQDMKDAQSILIVGGGSVGIEVAGEISDTYPKKRVTIVHWDVGLLHPRDSGGNTAHTYVAPPTSPKLGKALERQLTSRGVHLVLSDRVDFRAARMPGEWGGRPGLLGGMKKIPLVSGRFVEADYVFDSTGNKPNSQLVRDADEGALTTNGYVSIDEYFRVRGDPSGPLGGEYYAIGDVANAPSWKTGVAAQEEGRQFGAMMGSMIAGRRPKPYTPPNRLKESIVLLGSSGGAGVVHVPLLGSIRAPEFILDRKSQDFLAGKSFFGRFQHFNPFPNAHAARNLIPPPPKGPVEENRHAFANGQAQSVGSVNGHAHVNGQASASERAERASASASAHGNSPANNQQSQVLVRARTHTHAHTHANGHGSVANRQGSVSGNRSSRV